MQRLFVFDFSFTPQFKLLSFIVIFHITLPSLQIANQGLLIK